MKRIFFAVVIGLGVIAALSVASAQTDEKPTPKEPYLAPVPDYGHWVVTFKYEAAPSTPAANAAAGPSASAAKPPAALATPSASDGLPTSIDTIKTLDLRGVVLTFANGTTKQFTCQGDWVLASTAKGPQLSIAAPMSRPYVYYTTGFILLDGVKIDPSTFKEAAKHNGVLAFHYKSDDVDVWIDTDTMLPLAVKQPGVEASYQFLTPPPRPFNIPEDQAALLKKEQEAYKSTRSLR